MQLEVFQYLRLMKSTAVILILLSSESNGK